MDNKQSAIAGLGIVAVLGLFVVVYAQYAAKPASAPTTTDVPFAKSAPGQNVPEVVAEPETPEDIMLAIDAQLADEERSFDAEVAAETAANEEELKSLDELNDAYDENTY